MTWGQRRQLKILAILAGIVLVILAILLYPIITREPTCTDGKMNGSELGIDCGGSCAKICTDQAATPIVRYSRAFPVSGNTYNLLAYIENQNVSAADREIAYEFRLYDEENVYITKRTGKTFIQPNGVTPVFEASVSTGNRVPKRTTFVFTEPSDWIETPDVAVNLPVRILSPRLENETVAPRVTATLVNDSSFELTDLDVIAILYGADGNAFAVSKTLLDSVSRGEQKSLFFTWPNGFEKSVSRIEILPKVNVFSLRY